MDKKLFEKILQKTVGVIFDEKRVDYVFDRLRAIGWEERMLNYTSFTNILNDSRHKDYDVLVDLLTIHETYFFREYNQLEVFANNILNDYALDKKDKSIRIFSAGCSTGEEVYTLAIILKECLDDFEDYFIEFVGLDISSHCLEKARNGEFSSRSVKFVPEIYLKKYFRKVGVKYSLKKDLLPKIVFSQGSLSEDSSFKNLGIFDFIFCRNVLIYFNQESRLKIIKNFHKRLYPGGKLLLGHSESIIKHHEIFEPISDGNFPIYRRVS